MKLKCTLLLIVLALLFTNSSLAQSTDDYRSNFTTTGLWSAIGSWERYNGTIWEPAPAAPTSANGVITIQAGDSVRINSSITIDQVVIEPGAVLSVVNGAGTVSINDVALEDDIIVNGRLYVYGFSTLGGTGSVMVNSGGLMNVTTLGVLSANTTISAGADLLFYGSTPVVSDAVVTNNGTISWGPNNLNLNSATIINNGDFNAAGDNTIGGTGGLITNNGNFSKLGGTGNTSIAIPFTNVGVVNINTGTLLNTTAAAIFTNTGTINFNGTSFVNSSGTINFNVGSVINGVSTLSSISGPSLMVINENLSFTNVSITAGIINGLGSLTIPGILTFNAGTLGVPTVLSAGAVGNLGTTTNKTISADFINDGTINWLNGNITLANATLTNNGIIEEAFTANWAFLNGGGVNEVVNAGAINKTSAFSLTNNLLVPITNSGTLSGSGTYLFTGGLTNNPGATYAPGETSDPAILTVSNQAISANSTVDIEIGSSPVPGVGQDLLTISTGGVTPLAGTLNVTQDLTVPGGPLGFYTIMTTAGTFSGNFTTINLPTNFTYAGIVGGNTVQIEKIAIFPLPVKWGIFKAIPRENVVKINFSTLLEINTSHFIIEHSLDGQQYSAIASIPASENSEVENFYSFQHNQPNLSKNNFYRIKQIDLDGKFIYSEIRMVSFTDKAILVKGFPNPVSDVLYLSVQDELFTVQLMNTSGVVIKSIRLAPGLTKVNVSDLPSGVYIMSIFQDNKFINSQKLIKE